jgi:UDP-glucose 4-epimerase
MENEIQIIGRGYLGTLLARKLNCTNHPISLDNEIDILRKKFQFLIVASGPSSAAIGEQEATVFEKKFKEFINKIQVTNNKAHIIYVSSGGTVYGEGKETPFIESNDTEILSPYSKYQVNAETLLKKCHKGPFTILRLSNAYGPSQLFKFKQGFISAAIRSALMNQPLTVYGNGLITRDYMFEDDIVSAIAAVIDAPTQGTYNLGTGIGTTQRAIIDMVEKSFKKRIKVIHNPKREYDLEKNILCPELFQSTFNWRFRIDLKEGVDRYGPMRSKLIDTNTIRTETPTLIS